MEYDIAIIGAGAAGIGAARRLAGSGRSSVVIEAGARVGGRGWTAQIAGLALDLGCTWLHSAARNVWTGLAEAAGVEIHRGPPGWSGQFQGIGFSAAEQAAAAASFEAWSQRLRQAPPASDIAAEALVPGDEWNNYIRILAGYISGGALERMSARDYATYEAAATDDNWRLPGGYGALIASHLPAGTPLHLATPVHALRLERGGVALETARGTLRARAAILTVSTAILADEATLRLPAALAPWRDAAAALPLGRDERVILELVAADAFEADSYLLADPRDLASPSYGIRRMGLPVIECFLGNEGAMIVAEHGPAAGFAHVVEGLVKLLGGAVRRHVRPLASSDWTRASYIRGSYSYALPGQSGARQSLARPFEDRLFFAGEATSARDYTTAHGAHDSGVRAAEEALAALAGQA